MWWAPLWFHGWVCSWVNRSLFLNKSVCVPLILHAFFVSNTFISNARLKWQKIKQKLSNTLRLNFRYLKIIRFFHPRYHPEIIEKVLKNVQKTTASVLINGVVWLITMKMRLKVKNRSERYDINWPRPRHGHKFPKYKMCLIVMIVMH